MRPALDVAETAAAQVAALGHRVEDVTDIVLTHLDLDHAGGLADFPHARIHVYGDGARRRAQARGCARRPATSPGQWAHGPHWVRHEVAGDDWFGFEAVTALHPSADDDVLLVPLHGHTRGHCGVAVAGPGRLAARTPATPTSTPARRRRHRSAAPGLRLFQRLMAVDDAQRVANQARLRELHADHAAEVTVFSAHDATEYDALARWSPVLRHGRYRPVGSSNGTTSGQTRERQLAEQRQPGRRGRVGQGVAEPTRRRVGGAVPVGLSGKPVDRPVLPDPQPLEQVVAAGLHPDRRGVVAVRQREAGAARRAWSPGARRAAPPGPRRPRRGRAPR